MKTKLGRNPSNFVLDMSKVWNILEACLVEMRLGMIKREWVSHYEKALSSGTSIQLDNTSMLQAHRYALHNTDEVQPWIE